MVPIGGPTAIEGVWAIWIPERFLSASRGRSPIVGGSGRRVLDYLGRNSRGQDKQKSSRPDKAGKGGEQ